MKSNSETISAWFNSLENCLSLSDNKSMYGYNILWLRRLCRNLRKKTLWKDLYCKCRSYMPIWHAQTHQLNFLFMVFLLFFGVLPSFLDAFFVMCLFSCFHWMRTGPEPTCRTMIFPFTVHLINCDFCVIRTNINVVIMRVIQKWVYFFYLDV